MSHPKLIHYRNGCYHGQTHHNKRTGKGLLITDQGQILIGTFKNDKLFGFALVLINQHEYSYGEFNRGQLEGWSKFQSGESILVAEFSGNRTIHKQLLVDKIAMSYKVTMPSQQQRAVYETVKQQDLEETFMKSTQSSLQQLAEAELQAKLSATINYNLAEYLTELSKDEEIFQTETLMNGYLMFRIRDESSVVGLGLVINKNNQLVSYGSYIGSKLNGYGCKFENAVRYEGVFENGFLNGQGLKLTGGKYSFGGFENGTLVKPVYLEERSPASQVALSQLKKFTHITHLNFSNIYLPLSTLLKFNGTRQIIFQPPTTTHQQTYYPNPTTRPPTSPIKKPTNIATKLLINKQENDSKSSVSIMTNRKVKNNIAESQNQNFVGDRRIEGDQSRVSDISRSVSAVGSNRRFNNSNNVNGSNSNGGKI